MFFCGKYGDQCLSAPFRTLLPAFILPLVLLILPNRQSTLLPVSDALYGVGFVTLVFINGISRRLSINNAFMTAALLLVFYGIWRIELYGTQLDTAMDNALGEMNNLFPAVVNSVEFEKTVQIMKFMMPSIWIGTQVLGLFIGLLLFQRKLGLPFKLQEFTVSKYYSLVIIALIPLYFYEKALPIMANALFGLSTVLFLQGLGVAVAKGLQLISNKLILTVLLVFLIFNVVSYLILVLIGFADQWLNFRKIETGGTPA